ncbi:AMP-binding enzyme family protein [Mycolicibacterium hassiacum DSM 44199]|jgi:acyl-CoA synthetase (AMP-forming)/AMP-acid ligase II|uniref:Long-chain-fatty-acid--CoA ligase FadD13 n=1 Tax=Mycolicibacterium hassiacum (strain DSM 44199 / CIP 105218 / JCM 12690 / 3849) TaxID=1122247 RepID=K5BAF3_MYCHD|nr:3-((3aS,4S,7aS)-7a-methyl-1,5-dioxo-octahydro-1H-inden-4-yl)propanoate--CoA ligase FadD3 [Mycolicibacterium hassiacum]EKF22140.1 AMP-binding enzyme family protein [Mycolicibacterium hassiacum DSM 44199]MBX5486293.1 fatty acid--CoA ligase family protein [Mycolicibacterium hassiacum]MDA4086584.1 long-chain fatty acid--CoA ligase [Mycolicibacterium hassiacum DSM 44199]VCT92041.1 3-[(3aS,4S,7aS)-7a-methyl-1,5-dioxo-octahydro-1H-inden-4-yl]propanoyl:CoA ligase [Mycolicibacterium hassiacum DSM 441
MTDPRTIPGVLDRIADRFSEHDALVTADRRLTFAELRAEVRRAAAALIDLGVDPGDRVAIWSPNTWHWVVACLAIHHAGAILVPLNTRYTVSEAADILARTGAPVLFASGEFLGSDKAAAVERAALPQLRHIVRVPVEKADGTWDEFMARGTDLDAVAARADAVRPDDVADILFTSGTTGRSKGALCAHRQSLDASAAWAECGQLSEADRYLCINPFFHNFGYKAGILACLQTGATLYPQLTFDPERAMAAVQEHRITVLPGPPTIYQMILDHPKRADYDLSSLRFAVTGAAVVPVVLIERMQSELDIDIVLTAYGLTEASGFGTMCRPDDDAVTVATTCGRPIAGFELRIDNPAEDGTGEVLLRGPNVMLGYLDDPEATAAAIDADGWLHTGDVGRVDERGYLQITDRLKDMYICGGFNVYPAEVEQVLSRLDGVADVAVIGVPDERLGEVGKAFIVPKPGATLTEDAVIAYARQHLANFKAPRSVEFLDELPRNAGGKVVKPQLRERARNS